MMNFVKRYVFDRKVLLTGLTVSFCLFFSVTANAQLDSLTLKLEQAQSLEEQVDIYHQLSRYFETISPDTSLYLAEAALSLAQKAEYERGKAKAYLNIASYYSHNKRFNFDSLDYYLQQSVAIFRAEQDSLGMAGAYFSIGFSCYSNDNYHIAEKYCNEAVLIFEALEVKLPLAQSLSLLCEIHNYMGNNTLAMTQCYRALDIYEELEAEKFKPTLYNTMASVNYDLKNYDRAKSYLLLSIELAQKYELAHELSSAYISMGEVLRSTEDFQGAMDYFRRSLNLDRQNEDNAGISYAYLNIGKTLVLQGEYERAISLLEGALEISEDFGDLLLQARASLELGKAYYNLKDMEKAFDFLNKSLAYAKRVGLGTLLQECYINMANYYYSVGELENALVYFKFYDLEKERLYEQESAKRIAEMETVYELNKKEQTISILRQENQIQVLQSNERKMVNYGLILGVVLLSGLGMVLYSKYQLKNKANLELEKQKEAINLQKAKIEKQRDEIINKSKLLEESKQDITDSIMYAKRIQMSLLPEREHLKNLFPDSFVFFRPKDIVSGDFYWIHEVGEKVIVAVLDCTGHGVPGAFMTVLANSILNELVLENCVNAPNVILSVMDTKIREALHQNLQHEDASSDGLDMAVCIVNRSSMEVNYSGAQMPIFITHQHSLMQLNPNRHSLGGTLFREKSFSNQSVKLSRGDMIYLASDGFQDQFGGPRDKKFLRVNFKSLMEKIQHEPTPRQSQVIQEAFDRWKGEQTQTDDVLVIGLRI